MATVVHSHIVAFTVHREKTGQVVSFLPSLDLYSPGPYIPLCTLPFAGVVLRSLHFRLATADLLQLRQLAAVAADGDPATPATPAAVAAPP